MIAGLLPDRCTACNRCVTICPANVFEASASGPPIIARAADCQTCFHCELYCAADALYVAPDWERPTPLNREDIAAAATLGQYRAHSGWDEWAAQYPNEQWLMETVFRRAAAADRDRGRGR